MKKNMKKNMKKIKAILVTTAMATSLVACGSTITTSGTTETTPEVVSETAVTEEVESEETSEVAESEAEETSDLQATVTLAAAASLEKTFTEELIPMFNEMYPGVTIEGTYDSSGKLQTQIEEGAPVDIFFSAATKQMTALSEAGYIADDTMVELLENKIVLIVPTGSEEGFGSFDDIVNAEMVALGDPESVPAGQYGKEALESLSLWESVEGKLSLGTNVTEVLNWVAEGSAQAGIVYATDAASMSDKVTVIAEAPEGSVSPVIYPVAMLQEAQDVDAATIFLEFLQTEEALTVFETAGFTAKN